MNLSKRYSHRPDWRLSEVAIALLFICRNTTRRRISSFHIDSHLLHDNHFMSSHPKRVSSELIYHKLIPRVLASFDFKVGEQKQPSLQALLYHACHDCPTSAPHLLVVPNLRHDDSRQYFINGLALLHTSGVLKSPLLLFGFSLSSSSYSAVGCAPYSLYSPWLILQGAILIIRSP